MKPHRLALGLLLAASLGAVAQAKPVVLDFHGLDGTRSERPGDFYAGGLGSLGSGPGLDLGITFSSDARVDCVLETACDDPASADAPHDILRFLDPRAALVADDEDAPSVINVANGFTDALSFIYASSDAGSIRIWSGINGTGSLLGSFDLGVTAGCDDFSNCAFERVSRTFGGEAHSVEFVNLDFGLTGFDDITLGADDTQAGVPEPASWALMIGGFGLAGGALRRRRAASQAA